MITEKEALTQDCIGPPNCGNQTYKRITIGEAPGWADVPDRRLCIGSACKMAWRWLPREPEDGGYGDMPRPNGDGWYLRDKVNAKGEYYGVQRWVRDLPPTDAYCGLAGKP